MTRDVILTIYLALFILYVSFVAHIFWSITVALFIRSFVVFFFFFLLGFVVAMLSIHTVDHWVVFDTIFIHSATPI